MAENTEEEILENEVDEDLESEGEEEDEDEGSDEDGSGADDNIPVRKSNAYFVGLRQGKKAAKQSSKKDGEDIEDGENGLSDAADKAIGDKLEPLVKGFMKSADDIEIREYLADHPEAKKFETAIRKRAEVYKEVPISEIGKMVMFGKTSNLIAKKKEETEKRINGKALRGNSGRGEEVKLPSTPEEFQKIYDDVRKGKTVKLGE